MKRFAALLCAVLLLCGCTADPPGPTDPSETTPVDPTETLAVTQPRETAPPETDPPPATTPAETDPADPDGYTLSLGAAVPIFAGPSYDESYLRVVGEDGVYTIVEEVEDAEGNLWGRLKSGVGWIDLTALDVKTPVTAAFADEALLDSGNYHAYTAEDAEYGVKLAFRASEPVTQVQFSLLELDAESLDSYTVYRPLCILAELTPAEPFVAEVVFYGDLTAYGISFTDQNGELHHYAVTVSGRNGALVMTEYTPQ